MFSKHDWLVRTLAIAVLAVSFLLVGSGKVYAQVHDQRHERADFKNHQRHERRDFGRWAVRDHQRAEKRAFREQERRERFGYYGGNHGPYGYPSYGTYGHRSTHGNAYPAHRGGHAYPRGHRGRH